MYLKEIQYLFSLENKEKYLGSDMMLSVNR